MTTSRARRPRTAAMALPESAIEVFTDGACSGNPGPGGWAWALDDARHGSGSENPSTNQRMEVLAVLDALRVLTQTQPDPIVVVSDSTYVVNCFRDRWWKGWMERGWKNSQKQPVANQDLWKPLVELFLEDPDRIGFRWVKGHSGNRMNDFVDALAVDAAQSRSARRVVGITAKEAPSGAAESVEVVSVEFRPEDVEPLRLF